MKKLFTLILIFLSLLMPFSFAQVQDPSLTKDTEINQLKADLEQLKESLRNISIKLDRFFSEYNKNLSGILLKADETNNLIKSNTSDINQKLSFLSDDYNQLKKDIENLKANIQVNSDKLNQLNSDTNKNINNVKKLSIFNIIGYFASLIILILILLYLSSKLKQHLKKPNIEEEVIKTNKKLLELMENLLPEEKKPTSAETIDHSIPIKIACEIFRMKTRINSMDENTKGISALKNAIERIENELKIKGYEIKDLTGSNYEEGMVIKVLNVIEKDDIKPGARIIARMITPQIFFNGLLIHPGEAEVFSAKQ
jgi:hypothetical protein